MEDRERALADARAVALAVLAVPDAHPLGTPTFETIWAETPFPGLRIGVDGLQIDLGWGDPLARPPIALEVEGASLSAVVPEVLYGWKVHGLFEFGHGQWRPKDLFDLWLLDRSVKLDAAALVDATRVAFTSRGTSFALCDRFRTSAEWGRSRGSARRWAWFARKAPSTAPLPPYTEVVAAVRARLVPLLDRVAPIGPPSPP